MQESSFAQLAEESAAGLKADRELFLDVKEELQSHLEEKAGYFVRQGKSQEESAVLAKQSFGSPLDMAAELLDANRNRMKWRGLLRLAIGALLVPLAIVIALVMGYGQFGRQQTVIKYYARLTSANFDPPALPFLPATEKTPEQLSPLYQQLNEMDGQADNILHYWEAHRSEADSYMYYAYYCLFANPDNGWNNKNNEQQYIAALRQGEQLEPKNTLYNMLLAHYYLSRGMQLPDHDTLPRMRKRRPTALWIDRPSPPESPNCIKQRLTVSAYLPYADRAQEVVVASRAEVHRRLPDATHCTSEYPLPVLCAMAGYRAQHSRRRAIAAR